MSEVRVELAIFNDQNPDQFLIIKPEGENPDVEPSWTLPGKTIDADGDPTDTAVRKELAFGTLGAHYLHPELVGKLAVGQGESPVVIFAAETGIDDVDPGQEVAAFRWATEQSLPEDADSEHIVAVVEVGREALHAA